MSLNRISGLAFALFGLVLYFVIIPYDTEVVDYGWVRPQSVPNAMAWVMIIVGSIQAAYPSGDIDFDIRKSSLALFYLALVIGGVYLISKVGFMWVAPGLALLIMLAMGERRAHWIGLGVVGIPLLIWIIVTILLERPLP